MSTSTAGETTHFLEIRNASKRFAAPEGGSITALDRLSLAVKSNEFITLLGPSGCGKTTLLRAVSGFEDLDTGEVLIEGQEMTHVPAHRRPVNTVFQNYALFPHLSVGDNVGYSLDVSGVGRSERDKKVGQALEMIGLTGMERRRPSQLSGGQQQRVALARAIINRPKLLLLDEPLSALDKSLRQAMQLELKNLQHELGISFVFVTHDQEEALTMSDRIAVLDSGRIQQMGTPTEIYDRPENSFVSQFIGESNIFHGRVGSLEGALATVVTDEGPVLKLDHSGLVSGQRVTVVIRPEWFHMVEEGKAVDSSRRATISGVLRQAVFVGTDFKIVLNLPAGAEIKATIRDASRVRVVGLSPGQSVKLEYHCSAPHVINVENET